MTRTTVVVIAHDGWPRLSETLGRHCGPVILVDNGSADGSAVRARQRFPHVSVIELNENRGAVARNIGVRNAGTPYVAFADDDSWWAPGALDRAADHFDADPALGLIAARILVGEKATLDPLSGLMATSPLAASAGARFPTGGIPVLGFAACGAIVRRSAFLQAGGFDDVIVFGGEEERLTLDLAARGWSLRYFDDVVAHHCPQASTDRSGRAALLARNELLTAVMRRPWRHAAAAAWASWRAGGDRRAGLLSAVPRLGRAVAARRRVPEEVEATARLLARPVTKGMETA